MDNTEQILIDDIKENIKEHEKRIRNLENRDVLLGEKLETLIKLWKWAAVTSVSTVLSVWVYIIEQHIH